jgi:hypothetical protein
MTPQRATIAVIVCLILVSGAYPVHASTYDTPRIVQSKPLLPGIVRKTDLYAIAPQAYADGFTYRFVLETAYGQDEIHGRDMVVERLREAEAIAKLDGTSSSGTFGKTLGKPVMQIVGAGEDALTVDKSKPERSFLERTGAAIVAVPSIAWNGAVNIVEGSWSTIKRAPLGVARMARRGYDMATESRSDFEDGDFREVTGFSGTKRKLASELGVDVYSSNKLLQDELGRVSWAKLSGARIRMVGMAFLPIPAVVQQPWSYYKAGDRFAKAMTDSTPEDLKRRNLKALDTLGITEADARTLCDNKFYSPRHETSIVMAMEQMPKLENTAALLQSATRAVSETDARRHQQAIELLAALNNGARPLVRAQTVGSWPAAKDKGNRLIVPVPAENWMFTPETEAFLSAIRQTAGAKKPIEIWLIGTASKRLKKYARSDNMRIVENAWTRIAKG